MKKYLLAITFSHFGTEEEVKTVFAGKEVEIDTSEYEGTDEEHHSGILKEVIEVENENFRDFMNEYIVKNSYQGECFGIYNLDDLKTEIFTEDDM